jgi:kynurenine 3-monooxygenase
MKIEIRENDKVVIFGAGLVGSLLSILLSRKGFQVEIHEKRPDLRFKAYANLRSINLALSHRGWRILEEAGLADDLKKIALPMYGRLVHIPGKEAVFQPYGKSEQAIYSISRYKLNCFLLDKAEEEKNIKSFLAVHLWCVHDAQWPEKSRKLKT